MNTTIKWHGRLRKEHRIWRYDIYYQPEWMTDEFINGLGQLGQTWCHRDLMLRHIKNYGQDVCSWGFMSDGTKQLALAMIGYSYGEGARHHNLRPGKDDMMIAVAMKHHAAFAEEVLANLPDNWTLTAAEIFRWIKEREARLSAVTT